MAVAFLLLSVSDQERHSHLPVVIGE